MEYAEFREQVHNLAWLLERLEKLCGQLEERQREEEDLEKRQLLESAAGKVARKCVEIERLFRAVYRGTKAFQIESPVNICR